MKRYYAMSHKSRVMKLAVLRKRYNQMQAFSSESIIVQTLLEEMKLRIQCLEQLLG